MKSWERRLWAEVREFRTINSDIQALQTHLWDKQNEITIPDFILDEQMREEATQLITYAEKYETFDIRNTNLLPTPANRGPDFDERLREAMDVDALIEESAQELKDYANKRIPLPKRDLSEKDNDLIQKMSKLAAAVEVQPPPLLGVDINEEWVIENTLRKELPTEKRILVDEIYKMLVFNNEDPQTFTVEFWADHFKIPAAALRNIVNYIAFPVCDPTTKKVTKILQFIDSEMIQKAQQGLLPEDITRDEYLTYLEADYSQRMVEQHGEE